MRKDCCVIPLTQGYEALVDWEDAGLLAFKWYAKVERLKGRTVVYAKRDTPEGCIAMHRQIVGAQKGEVVDHRSGDGLDNRRANLRRSTHSLNGLNRAAPAGVHFAKSIKRWVAYMTVNRKRHHLGSFATEAEARGCRDAAEREMEL